MLTHATIHFKYQKEPELEASQAAIGWCIALALVPSGAYRACQLHTQVPDTSYTAAALLNLSLHIVQESLQT